ncbi:MAG: hypothetical protein ACOX87_09070 [Chloroflexota bacterium]
MFALSFLLALAILISIQPILLGGTIYDDDILLMSIPVYSWYGEQLRQGVLPIWSPAFAGGFPLAFAIYGFFYPPDILFYRLMDAPRAFHLSLSLHLALIGICTYWYCRVLGLRRLPSLVAAVAFQMGNQVLAWPSNGFITKALFALPALLAVIELMIRRSWRYWVLAPIIVAVALLAGHAQAVLSALAAAGVYCLVVAAIRWPAIGSRATIRFLLLLGLGVALGLSLAAVRVVPTLEITSLTMRASGMGFNQSAVDSIEPWALVAGYLLPAVFELPGRAVARPDYVGAPVLFLAILALLAIRRLDRVARFHTGFAGIVTVLSLGEFTPAYGWLLQLPFFSYFREPNRLSLVSALSIAVLAAYALDRRLALDLSAQKRRYRGLVVLGWLVVVAGGVYLLLSLAFQFGKGGVFNDLHRVVEDGGLDALNLLRPRVGVAVLSLVAAPILLVACARQRITHRLLELSVLTLTVGTLFILGWVQNLWMPPTALYDPPALLQTLKSETEPFRVYSWAPRVSTYNVRAFYEGIVGYPPSREFEERYQRQFIPPNLGMLFGVQSVEWYDALHTRRQALVSDYIGSERAEWGKYEDGSWADWNLHNLSLHDRLNLLAALNVKYLTHAFQIEDDRLEMVDEVSLQIYPELPATAKVYLYRLKTAMPRAIVVPESIVMTSERQVLETMMAGDVDLRQRVILETTPPSLENPQLTAQGSSVDIVDYGDDRVVIDVRTDGSGFLVLMDFLLPGWTATVDGREEEILAGNFAGRAVPIRSAGDHRVEFSYEAPRLREGLLISLLSAGILLGVSLVTIALQSRQAKPSQ